MWRRQNDRARGETDLLRCAGDRRRDSVSTCSSALSVVSRALLSRSSTRRSAPGAHCSVLGGRRRPGPERREWRGSLGGTMRFTWNPLGLARRRRTTRVRANFRELHGEQSFFFSLSAAQIQGTTESFLACFRKKTFYMSHGM